MKRQTYLPPVLVTTLPQPLAAATAARTADAAVGARDTDPTRASHLTLRLKSGEKLHAGFQSSKNASDICE